MGKVRRVDYYPDEFLVGIADLDHDEIGPYWVACSLMYSRGGAIPDDDQWIARACCCHWRTWRRIRGKLIAVGKLRVTSEGFLTNGRTETEIRKALGRIGNAHAAAEESARARAERALEDHGEYDAEPEADPLINGAGMPQEARRTGAGEAQEPRTSGAEAPQESPETAKINGLGQATAQIPHELTTNQQPATTNLLCNGENHIGSASANSPDGEGESGALILNGGSGRSPAERMFEAWCAAAERQGWPRPRSLTTPRRKAIIARIKDAGGEVQFLEVLALAEKSRFIREDMTAWCLDWMLKPTNFCKVQEGNYQKDHQQRPRRQGPVEGVVRGAMSDVTPGKPIKGLLNR